MEKKYNALCIGSITQDIVFLGIPLDALSRDTVGTNDALFTVGGDATNQCAAITALGNKAALLTKIGDDNVSDFLLSNLIKEGIDTSFIMRDPRTRNFVSNVIVKENGDRTFIQRHANEYFTITPSDVTDEMLSQSKVVTIGSMYTIPGLDGDPMADVLKRAKEQGCITVADMTSDVRFLGPHAMDNVFKYVDYMFPSEVEAQYVTEGETDTEKIADYFFNLGAGHVIIKMGEKGCFYKDSQTSFRIPAFDVAAIDTTGCGDNFVAGFVHSIVRGWDIHKCLDFACATGGLNATMTGPHNAITEEMVIEFMNKTPRLA